MEIVLSDRAIEDLKDAPPNVRRAFEKQIRFLAANLQHPSLHAKKYDEAATFGRPASTGPGASFSRSRMIPTASKM
jgi:hypothetical protein